jgi:hypothetical protein
MYLAYLDESGDAGCAGISPTDYFVVGCLVINADYWLDP